MQLHHVLAAMLTVATVSAQIMPEYKPRAEEFKITADANQVLLDVMVKDSRGGFASGLLQDSFKVFEDGKEQKLNVFAARDIPVTVGLVVDNSGSMRMRRPQTVTAALSFVRESSPQDEVFVVNFNDVVRLGLPEETPFTDDTNILRNALLANPVQGRTALYDALVVALNQLDKGRKDKKTLVVVSDGGDNASDTSFDQVLHMAQESNATIYTIGIFSPGDKDMNPGVLKKIAVLTGGEAFFPKEDAGLVDACRKIARDIRNRYTLGYVPQDLKYDGKPRKLLVAANASDRGKLSVRTRTSYIPRQQQAAEASRPVPSTYRPPIRVSKPIAAPDSSAATPSAPVTTPEPPSTGTTPPIVGEKIGETPFDKPVTETPVVPLPTEKPVEPPHR